MFLDSTIRKENTQHDNLYQDLSQTNILEREINQKIKGIAVKLSQLDKLKISIDEILSLANCNIIIDAEIIRLDNWIINLINQGRLSSNEIRRIIVTVQIKRDDAYQQLDNLMKLGIKVVLVFGNKKYLQDQEKIKSGTRILVDMISKYDNIAYYGINTKTKDRLENKYSLKLDNQKILELYGDHQLSNSSLWVYYNRDVTSKEVKEYLSRRIKSWNNDTQRLKYIISTYQELSTLTNGNSVYLFIDTDTYTCFQKILREFSLI